MSSPGAPSAGPSTPPSYSLGPSTPPSYSSGPSTPPNYSSGSSKNAECSNFKHLREKISVLKATVNMHMHPEQHTVNSAALLHEVLNEMEKLDLETNFCRLARIPWRQMSPEKVSSAVPLFLVVVTAQAQWEMRKKDLKRSLSFNTTKHLVSNAILKLKCPVKTRDLLKKNNKESTIIYLRAPGPIDLCRDKRVSENREDSWMEVRVWKFVYNNEIKDNYIPMELKLSCLGGICLA
nr:serine/threonine-protein kinase, active site protein [Tanacetum cinerariifolium]